MNLAIFADIPLSVQIHIVAALAAIALGPFAIYRRRRDRMHKIAGCAWISAMVVTALSSFAIEARLLHFAFGLGAIHVLSAYVLLSLWLGVRAARAGRFAQHGDHMAGLYWQGLIVAGLLTFLPGRTLNTAFFPEAPMASVWLLGGAGAWLILEQFRRRAGRASRIE